MDNSSETKSLLSKEEAKEIIKSYGFSDPKGLSEAIANLDLEIANAKDNNQPFEEKQKLRDKYALLKHHYDLADKTRSNMWKKTWKKLIFLGIGAYLLILIIILVVMMVFIG